MSFISIFVRKRHSHPHAAPLEAVSELKDDRSNQSSRNISGSRPHSSPNNRTQSSDTIAGTPPHGGAKSCDRLSDIVSRNIFPSQATQNPQPSTRTQKPYKSSHLNLVEGCSKLSRSKRIGVLPVLSLNMMIDFAIIPRTIVIDDNSRSASATDALAQGISLSRMMVNAGDALPAPFVKGAAGVILALLEPIQQLQKNQDDHKELTIDIAKIVWMMKEMALDPESPEQSPKLRANLAGFESALLRILEDLNKTMVKYSYMKQMWKTYSIGQWLASSQKMVHELRMNMLLVNTTDTRRHVHAIHEAMVQSSFEPGSPRLGSSISDSELSDFVRLVPGDLELIEACNDPFGNPIDLNGKGTENNTVKVVDTLKTGRFYNGPNAAKKWDADLVLLSRMRHLHILQLFGVCSSARRPALVFHEELHIIPEFTKKSMFTPLQSVMSTYHLLNDYQSACYFLKQNFLTDCMAYPRPAARMYYTGCPCPMGSSHSYRFEMYVNSLGKLHLSIYTDSDIIPQNVYRHGYGGFEEFLNPMQLGVLGKIAPPNGRVVAKSKLPIQTKRSILWAFHSAVLHQGYASDAVLLPSSECSQELISFGEICATRQRYDLDAMRRDPPRGRLCLSIGKAVFPESIRRRGNNQQSVQWHHPGAVFEDIAQRRRFEIKRSTDISGLEANISCLFSLRIAELDTIGAFWLSQANSIQAQIQPYLLDPRATISLVTEVECSFEYQTSFDEFSFRPDIKAAYLFVHHLECSKEGTVSTPKMYWSEDAEGAEPMDPATMVLFGLRLPKILMRGKGICWSSTQLEAVRQFHQECGFDPDTDEVAQTLARSVVKFKPVLRVKRRSSRDFEAEKLWESILQQEDCPSRKVIRRRSVTFIRDQVDQRSRARTVIPSE